MTDDETLDLVIDMWRRADEHTGKADFLNDQANNEQSMANELEDEAEKLWAPLADAHPEWFDALHVGEDPRIAPPGAEETLDAIRSLDPDRG